MQKLLTTLAIAAAVALPVEAKADGLKLVNTRYAGPGAVTVLQLTPEQVKSLACFRKNADNTQSSLLFQLTPNQDKTLKRLRLPTPKFYMFLPTYLGVNDAEPFWSLALQFEEDKIEIPHSYLFGPKYTAYLEREIDPGPAFSKPLRKLCQPSKPKDSPVRKATKSQPEAGAPLLKSWQGQISGAPVSVTLTEGTLLPANCLKWEWGAEDSCPKSYVASLEIMVGNDVVFVPRSSFSDLGNPKLLSVTPNKKGFSIGVKGGDAAVSYEAKIFVAAKRVTRRIVRYGEFPDTSWERTEYSPEPPPEPEWVPQKN